MEKLKVIVAGSRFFNDRATIYKTLNRFVDYLFEPGVEIEFITGSSKGTELLTKQYAEDNQCLHKIINIDKNNGNKAYMIRNENMAKETDVLIAFYGGFDVDKETKFIIDAVMKERKEVYIIPVEIDVFNETNQYKNEKKEFVPKDEYKNKKDYKQKKSFRHDKQKRS